MIASFTNNFIFIKTRKTSGTSAEIIMSTWCSEKDICTPISPDDEIERRRLGGSPMNYRRWFIRRFTSHMSARELSSKLPGLWTKAHKFTVDRHPYEKVLSQTAYRLGRKGDYSFADFRGALSDIIEEKTYLNYPLYMNGNSVMVDELIRYEHFWDRLEEFARERNLVIPRAIPRAKGHFKKDFVNLDILTCSMRKSIYSHSAIEFELFSWDR